MSAESLNLRKLSLECDSEKYLTIGKNIIASDIGKAFSYLSLGLSLDFSKKEEYYKLYLHILEQWSSKLLDNFRYQDCLTLFDVAQEIYCNSADLNFLLAGVLFRFQSVINMASETWKSIFRECFGFQGLIYCKEVWPILVAVDQGIKPAFLWDVCTPDTSALISLLLLASQKELLSPNLKVVEVDLDVFIVNLTSLIRVLTSFLTNDNSWLIDISVSEPKVANKETHIMFRNHLVSLLKQLGISSPSQKQTVNSNSETTPDNRPSTLLPSSSSVAQNASNTPNQSPKDIQITIRFLEEVNLSTIFGCILGYPQVYWWQGESGGNSLTGVPLKVFKFGALFTPNCDTVELFSFSIPEALEGDLRPSIEEWGNVVNAWVEKSQLYTQTKFYCDPVLCLSVEL